MAERSDLEGVQSQAMVADFSQAAVSRAVFKATAQKPLVVYPVTLALLGGLAAVLLETSTLLLALTSAGGLIGLGSWLFNATLRRNHHAGIYLERLRAQLTSQTQQSVALIQGKLNEVKSEAGSNQLQRLQAKYDAFQRLLGNKLNPSELTFARYAGITEQVFLSVLDNLTRVGDILQGLQVIDEHHIRERLLELDSRKSESSAENAEYQALSERLKLCESQKTKTQQLLTQNESAMTEMDKIMAAIAEMDTSRPHASMDMELAMQELQRLSARSSQYSTR